MKAIGSGIAFVSIHLKNPCGPMFRRYLFGILKVAAWVSAVTAFVILLVSLTVWGRRPSPGSAEGVLTQADRLAWNNNWAEAGPLYSKAELMFERNGDHSHALYARVSRVPLTMEAHDLAPLI